jgi:beclin
VYNDAFCIGHDGVFGTINNLRLGRVPGVPVRPILYVILLQRLTSPDQVEWAEINAAWGQTLLLLYTIARKLDFVFEKFVSPIRRQVMSHSRSRIVIAWFPWDLSPE